MEAESASGERDLGDRLARLDPRQRAALYRRLSPPAKPDVEVRGTCLTPGQESGFSLAAHAGTLPIFNMSAAWRLAGPLDQGALGSALDLLVARHEALRTAIAIGADGRPAPWVPARCGPALAIGEPVEGAARAAAAVVRRSRTGLDIGAPPHLRGVLYEIGPSDHVLTLVAHHLAIDGGSIEILLRQLSVLYAALASGTDPPPVSEDLACSDAARTIRHRLEHGGRDAALAYWRAALAPPLPSPAFATTDAVRRPQLGTAHESLVSPAAAARAVAALAKAERTTVFMVALAALATVLAAATGRDEVTIASDLSNRHRGQGHDVVGLFANVIVLRLHPAPTRTFRELIGEARRVVLGATEHGELPFAEVAADLEDLGLDRLALFDVSLAVRTEPPTRPRFPGVVATPFAASLLTSGPGHFSANALRLELRVTDQGIGGYAQYHPQVLDAPSVRAIGMRLWPLLISAAQHPDSRLADLAPAHG
jgi:hypothetical protein